MYHLSYLDIKHGFREGGQIDPPFPSISWFSSTPAGIGLNFSLIGVGQRIIIINVLDPPAVADGNIEVKG